jgi:hypothetical protein
VRRTNGACLIRNKVNGLKLDEKDGSFERHVMRGLFLLLAGAVTIVSPAKADCGDDRQVFKPASGKMGFRLEIVTETDSKVGQALVYRPFSSAPDTYQLIVEQTSPSGSRYRIIGRAGNLRLEVSADGKATVESNREIPALWRLACS